MIAAATQLDAVSVLPAGYRGGLATLGMCAAGAVCGAELPVSPLIPGVLLVLALMAAMLSLRPSRTHRRGILPKPLISILSLVGFLAAFYEIMGLGAPAVLALSHFFVWIITLKLLDRTTARDDAELLITTLFLMVIGGIISGQVLFGILLAVYLVVGIRTLMYFHLKCEQERIDTLARSESPGKPGAERPREPRVHAVAQHNFSGRFGALLYRTIGVSLLTGALVFLLFPRIGSNFIGRAATPLAMSMTGFSDRVRFGDMAEIKRNERVVMRVEVLENGEPAGSPNRQPYFRGMTLPYYDGREWRWSEERYEAARPGGLMLPANYRIDPLRDHVLEQRFWLMNPATRYLFSTYVPYQVDFDPELTVAVRRSDRSLRLAGPRPSGVVAYTVKSVTRMTPRLAQALAEYEQRGRENPDQWLFDRPERPRREIAEVVPQSVRTYTAELIAGLPPPTDTESIRAVASRIEGHLLAEPFSYTLDRADVSREREPTEDFLLHRRKGHCEYFASAMTVMCQLAGLRARMVNGYRGGEWNATGGYYLVTEADAHSWVEVYTGEGDWETFDPTPGSVNVQRNADSLWSTLRGIVAHFQVLWADRVVSYNAANRDVLLANFGDWLAELGKHKNVGAEIWYAARELLLGPAALAWYYRVMYWIVLVLCLLAAYMAFRMLYRPVRAWARWVKRAVSPSPRRKRAESFYTRTLDLLTLMGHPKPEWTTPLEHMSGLAAADERFASLPRVARAFYEVHFGGRALTRGERRELDELIGQLTREPAGTNGG